MHAGRLQRVMADWDFGAAPVMLLVAARKGRSSRTQALVNFLLEAARR